MPRRLRRETEATRYSDYHPKWLEKFIEESFPHLARRKKRLPYLSNPKKKARFKKITQKRNTGGIEL